MRRFRLLQSTHEITSTNGSFNSRGEPAAFAASPRAMQPKPQRAARVKPHLTMRPKLRFVRSPPLHHLARGSGVACSWRALRSKEPSGGALRRAAFSAANEECEPTSDAPCHRAASDRSPPLRGQNRFPRRPVKGAGFPGSERLSSTSASRFPERNWAWIRCRIHRAACPRFREAIRREPATVTPCFAAPARFPTLFRLINPQVVELDVAASAGSSPAGAQRRAPPVDFCNRHDPQARPSDRRDSPSTKCAAGCPTATLERGFAASFDRGAKPRGHGSEALMRMAFSPPSKAPSGAIARAESFAPTRLRSDTSCRAPEASPKGNGVAVRTRLGPALPHEIRLATRLAPRRKVRAASRASPRRGARSAAPEVPSIAELPHWGGALSTSCPQPVDGRPNASSIFTRPHALTKGWESEDSAITSRG